LLFTTNGASAGSSHQLAHPAYARPELLATDPRQLWNWDITKLLGPAEWTYFYLYVILDVFSRYVVGWKVAEGESAQLAKRVIGDTREKQRIRPGELTLHADRGSSMTSKPVTFLMADPGITKTHSPLHVSDDNPYSESHSVNYASRCLKHFDTHRILAQVACQVSDRGRVRGSGRFKSRRIFS
jgi:putative transposase